MNYVYKQQSRDRTDITVWQPRDEKLGNRLSALFASTVAALNGRTPRRQFQHLTLFPTYLCVDEVYADGRSQSKYLGMHDLQAVTSGKNNRLHLTTRTRSYEIGQFLNPAQRLALADMLNKTFDEHRNATPSPSASGATGITPQLR